MFDHVTIRVTDRHASERFYDTVLTPLGIDRTYRTSEFSEWRDFSLTGADRAELPTRRLHVAFVAPTREQVEDFLRTGRSDDGRRVLDPDGNTVEAMQHDRPRRGAVVGHLRIGVADVAASKRFYETIAGPAGLRLTADTPERAEFAGDGGSFSLVASDEPTEHLHMAFGTADDEDVRRFHELATAAGHPSHGPPGERPRYHPGYYAAYVLDPDGNNIEVVNHHR
jgi:catechol 2,3-dioxygenase-like lactoylglutathione lyase family enzyme